MSALALNKAINDLRLPERRQALSPAWLARPQAGPLLSAGGACNNSYGETLCRYGGVHGGPERAVAEP